MAETVEELRDRIVRASGPLMDTGYEAIMLALKGKTEAEIVKEVQTIRAHMAEWEAALDGRYASTAPKIIQTYLVKLRQDAAAVRQAEQQAADDRFLAEQIVKANGGGG